MKICYTAIFGNYDQLHAPTVITPGWKYVCITDDPDFEVPEPYIKALASQILIGHKYAARQMKILSPYPEADLTVWHDGNIQVCCNLDELVETYHRNEITVMKHPTRSSIKEELIAVDQLRKDTFIKTSGIFFEYEKFLQTHKEPPLPATGVMIRTFSKVVQEFQFDWWRYVDNYSHRDQLSFGMAQAKTGVRVGYMPFEVIHGSHFKWRPHT